MKASRLVTAVAAMALAAGLAPVAGQGRPAQGSPVITAADGEHDRSNGMPTGKRQ